MSEADFFRAVSKLRTDHPASKPQRLAKTEQMSIEHRDNGCFVEQSVLEGKTRCYWHFVRF